MLSVSASVSRNEGLKYTTVGGGLFLFYFVILFAIGSRTEANGSSNADNLTVKDLQNILLECYGVMAKWQNFGLALNISQDEIGIIDAENDFIDNKFRKMITIWLQSGTGEKTWTVIANALGCSTVGRNDLKTIILEKY